MGTYQVTSPSGKRLRITGNKPPDKATLDQIFARSDAGAKPEKSWSQKAAGVPILGDIANILAPSGTALAAKQGLPTLEATTKRDQDEALRLAKQARTETDPAKKAQMLQRSRDLSRGATAKAEKFEQGVRAGSGTFTGMADAGVRTDTAGQKLSAYGPAAVRAGVSAGSLLAPVLLGKQAVASTAGARILQAGKMGAATGGIYGAAKEDDATLGERGVSAVTGGVLGGITGAGLQAGVEGGSALIRKIAGSGGKVKQKLIDAYKSTLKQNVKDKTFFQQYGGVDKVVADSIKYEFPNTKDSVVNMLDDYGPEYNEIIKREAAKAQGAGESVDIASAFNRAKNKVIKDLGHDDTLKKSAAKWFKDNAYKYTNQPSAKPLSANKLRIKFDKRVGSKLVGDITASRDIARKAFASELRMSFKDIVGQDAREAITKYHLLSGLANAMMKEPKFGIVEVAGAAASPGTGKANLLELAIFKAIRSPGVKRAIAKQGVKGVEKVSMAMPSGKTEQVPVWLVNLVRTLLDKEKK